jgi:hypothetical protein
MRIRPGESPACARCAATRIKPGAANPSPAGGAAAPLLEGTNEDDDQPYRVPGDPDQEPCPGCRKSLPRGAVVCNHCGYDRQTGTTLERVYEPVDKQWEAGLRFPVRFGIFLAVQGVALAATVVFAVTGGGWVASFISWSVGVALLAFVVGSYPRVNLERNRRGQVRLTKTWRIGFIPVSTADIRWRRYEGVIITLSRQIDFWDWFIIVSLVPWGLVPAILWWICVVDPDRFDVSLSQHHGFPALLLYRGRNEVMAKDIAGTIRSVTGLP